MERNEHADAFADCVVRRTEWDTVMNPAMVLATMLVPFIIAFVIIPLVLPDDINTVFSEVAFLAGGITSLVTECCVISLLLYMMAGRTAKHQGRDMIWADSLIGYAASKGFDTTELESLAKKMHKKWRAPLKAISLLFFALNVLYLFIIAGVCFVGDGQIGDMPYLLTLVGYALVLIQFLLTVGATYGFPFKHEKAQIAFTEELSSQLSRVGIDIGPMPRIVGRRHWIICILLFIITLGLFSIVMFVLACRNMNLHLHNQWDYEQHVLDVIITHEGGKGVKPVEGLKAGMGKRILRSVF